jgi:branched-chain amino acid transport system ATP-binding protein
VLLLDEPTEGLAPVIVAEVRAVLERIRDDGGTVIVAEPTTRLLPERIDHGYVMMRGAIVAQAGSRQELREAFAAQFAGLPALQGKEA